MPWLQPHADHAADRQAGVVEALPARGVGAGQHVAAELGEAVLAIGHIGGAMAALVEAQHMEFTLEPCEHRVPHAMVRSQRTDHDQRRSVGAAIEPPVDAGAIGLGEGHGRVSEVRSGNPPS